MDKRWIFGHRAELADWAYVTYWQLILLHISAYNCRSVGGVFPDVTSRYFFLNQAIKFFHIVASIPLRIWRNFTSRKVDKGSAWLPDHWSASLSVVCTIHEAVEIRHSIISLIQESESETFGMYCSLQITFHGIGLVPAGLSTHRIFVLVVSPPTCVLSPSQLGSHPHCHQANPMKVTTNWD